MCKTSHQLKIQYPGYDSEPKMIGSVEYNKAPNAPKAPEAPEAPEAPKQRKAPNKRKAPEAPKQRKAPNKRKAPEAPKQRKAPEEIKAPEEPYPRETERQLLVQLQKAHVLLQKAKDLLNARKLQERTQRDQYLIELQKTQVHSNDQALFIQELQQYIQKLRTEQLQTQRQVQVYADKLAQTNELLDALLSGKTIENLTGDDIDAFFNSYEKDPEYVQ